MPSLQQVKHSENSLSLLLSGTSICVRPNNVWCASDCVKTEKLNLKSSQYPHLRHRFKLFEVGEHIFGELGLSGQNLTLVDLSLIQTKVRFREDNIVAFSLESLDLSNNAKSPPGFVSFSKTLLTSLTGNFKRPQIVILSTPCPISVVQLGSAESIKVPANNLKGATFDLKDEVPTQKIAVAKGPGTLFISNEHGFADSHLDNFSGLRKFTNFIAGLFVAFSIMAFVAGTLYFMQELDDFFLD